MTRRRGRLGLAAGAAGFVFLLVWQQIQSVRLAYRAEATRRLIGAQRERNAYLRLELERRSSPASVAAAARGRLGLVEPSPESVVVLEDAARGAGGLLARVPTGARALVERWLPRPQS